MLVKIFFFQRTLKNCFSFLSNVERVKSLQSPVFTIEDHTNLVQFLRWSLKKFFGAKINFRFLAKRFYTWTNEETTKNKIGTTRIHSAIYQTFFHLFVFSRTTVALAAIQLMFKSFAFIFGSNAQRFRGSPS